MESPKTNPATRSEAVSFLCAAVFSHHLLKRPSFSIAIPGVLPSSQGIPQVKPLGLGGPLASCGPGRAGRGRAARGLGTLWQSDGTGEIQDTQEDGDLEARSRSSAPVPRRVGLNDGHQAALDVPERSTSGAHAGCSSGTGGPPQWTDNEQHHPSGSAPQRASAAPGNVHCLVLCALVPVNE